MSHGGYNRCTRHPGANVERGGRRNHTAWYRRGRDCQGRYSWRVVCELIQGGWDWSGTIGINGIEVVVGIRMSLVQRSALGQHVWATLLCAKRTICVLSSASCDVLGSA